jgi:replicative DNA helicase
MDTDVTGPLIDDLCAACRSADHDAVRAEVVAQEDDALSWLDRDLSVEPTWWSRKVTAFAGPIMPGITLVCARPGNGKSTLVNNQILHVANDPSQKVLVVPLETPPSKLRITLAAMEEGLNPGLVRRRDWSALPPDAKDRIIRRMGQQSAAWGGRVRMVNEDRITLDHLLDKLRWAHEERFTLVIVDHLHEIAWTDHPDQLTAAMTEGMRRIREALREYEGTDAPVRLLAACQLRRPSGFDPLEEYMVPPLSAIKQSGAAEEVAAYVYMLYRSLRPDVTAGDLKLVRGGQATVADIAEIGATRLYCAKHRDDGQLKGQEITLYIQEDRLLDAPPTSGWVDVGHDDAAF